MNERLGETRLNKQGTIMKIVRYGSNTDIDIEFMDDFHYIKEHQTYSNFKTGGIKNPCLYCTIPFGSPRLLGLLANNILIR